MLKIRRKQVLEPLVTRCLGFCCMVLWATPDARLDTVRRRGLRRLRTELAGQCMAVGAPLAAQIAEDSRRKRRSHKSPAQRGTTGVSARMRSATAVSGPSSIRFMKLE